MTATRSCPTTASPIDGSSRNSRSPRRRSSSASPCRNRRSDRRLQPLLVHLRRRFPDYPKMGVWPDAYYITYNLFNNAGTAFLGTKVCAFDRAKMLTGRRRRSSASTPRPPSAACCPGDFDGTSAAAGRRTEPGGRPRHDNTLATWKFHVDWTTPANTTFTGPTTLTVAVLHGGMRRRHVHPTERRRSASTPSPTV